MMKSKELKSKIYSHAHSLILTLSITCTCCYDVINKSQDLKTCSQADSLILFHFLLLTGYVLLVLLILVCFSLLIILFVKV